jgi:hypothetical protein
MAYYEQPGRTTSVDSNGKQTVTITYVGTEEAPLSSDISGTIRSRSVTKSEAGQIRTQYQIETDLTASGGAGFTGQGSALNAGISYEYVSAVRTVPIEAHPNFGGSQISSGGFIKPEDIKLIKDTVQTPGKTFDDISDSLVSNDIGRCRSLYGYLAKGVESYYVPSMVVRKTYQASSPPSGKRVGKISSPGGAVPGTPKGATFLLINVSARGTTGAYTVTEEYEMSGEDGWDTYLYGS